MGYRSEVTLALSFSANYKLKQLYPDVYKFLLEADLQVYKNYMPLCYIYQWSYIKWYDNDNIQTLENFLKNKIESNEYKLIILGEALNDINIEGIMDIPTVKIHRHVEIG